MAEYEKREIETNNIISALCDQNACTRPNSDRGSENFKFEIDSQVLSTYLLLIDQLQRIKLEEDSYLKKINTLQERLSKLSLLLFALRGIDSETLSFFKP